MKIIKAKNLGFCYGVTRSLQLAQAHYEGNVYTLGEIIHNSRIVKQLERRNIKAIKSLDEAESGTIIVRSHGAPIEVIEEAKRRGFNVVDATCPFVNKTRKIVSEKYAEGFTIAIFGKKEHPEVVGINSLTNYTAIILDGESIPEEFYRAEKVCLVAQTTASNQKFSNIINKIVKDRLKTLEIFKTICYTTEERQREAEELSTKCDIVLVIGDPQSSNTLKLKEICEKNCKAYLVSKVEDIASIKIKVGTVGIVAGASAPSESITEVIQYMENNFTEANNEEFLQAVDAVGTNGKLKEGKRMKVKVTSADEKGITVTFGMKLDGFISADEATIDGTYKPEDYPQGTELEVVLLSAKAQDGVYPFSKKKVDKIKEGDKLVDTIRNNEVFELVVERDTKGGLLGKLGTYTVFIPASQIKEKFVRDLKPFVGKTLRLVALEINDAKRRIVASQKVILEKERKEREDIFWANVVPGVIVTGKVKGISKFGAFVSVDGYDCLVHISDVSWTKFKSIEDILHVGKKYDFAVLKADREKNKVSLGYKQLQRHPFDMAIEEHPVGSIVKGKVTSLMNFGAFVEIAPGVEGLVHVSEASNTYVKNINDVFKVGDEVEVKILAIDPEEKKITLSAKACMPELTEEEQANAKAAASEKKESKPRKPRTREQAPKEESMSWTEDSVNNPFADLFKDFSDKD